MKNKGFTLIELLAVIVILSIIAIITVPMIMNVIDKAKLGALEDSAYGLIESANLYYAKNMDHIESYTLFEIQDGKQTSESQLEFKGKIDGNAKIVLTKEGKVALCLTSGKTYTKKEIEESKVTTASVSSDTTCTIPNLADNDFTISIEGSSGNYYDKDAIDIKINDLQTKIDTINNTIGTTDISHIGDGTMTGAIKELDNSLSDLFIIKRKIISTEYSLTTESSVTFNAEDYITIPDGYKVIGFQPFAYGPFYEALLNLKIANSARTDNDSLDGVCTSFVLSNISSSLYVLKLVVGFTIIYGRKI